VEWGREAWGGGRGVGRAERRHRGGQITRRGGRPVEAEAVDGEGDDGDYSGIRSRNRTPKAPR
jgi:hypothetical protein